jgi:SAM-dependent methyltransferase
MKLSELVAYRTHLSQFDVEEIQYTAQHRLSSVLYSVKSSVIQPRTYTQTLQEDQERIVDAFGHFNSTVTQLIRELDCMIEVAEKTQYSESSRLYKEEMQRYGKLDQPTNQRVDQHILGRRMLMTADVQQMISNRIKGYVDWKYPGLIIRPGEESFVKDLVGLDPLYLVDYSKELLAPAYKLFPEEYQRRLRMYYQDPTSDRVLDFLPSNQFGLCLAFNFFEFTPLEVIEQYLKSIFKKLRPGGLLAMTFNDCDRAHCVALVEKNFCFYTPGRRVKDIARSIGYRQMFEWTDAGNLTWLELRKPGELKSIRGGQTLAKIIQK